MCTVGLSAWAQKAACKERRDFTNDKPATCMGYVGLTLESGAQYSFILRQRNAFEIVVASDVEGGEKNK